MSWIYCFCVFTDFLLLNLCKFVVEAWIVCLTRDTEQITLNKLLKVYYLELILLWENYVLQLPMLLLSDVFGFIVLTGVNNIHTNWHYVPDTSDRFISIPEQS